MDASFEKTRSKCEITCGCGYPRQISATSIGWAGCWTGLVLAVFVVAPLVSHAQQPAKAPVSDAKVKVANPLSILQGTGPAKIEQPSAPVVVPPSDQAIPLAQVAD